MSKARQSDLEEGQMKNTVETAEYYRLDRRVVWSGRQMGGRCETVVATMEPKDVLRS